MKAKIILSTILIVASISWGCNSADQKSSANEQVQQKEQVKAPAQKATQSVQSGEVDKYGRKPGTQHYGHNHSPTEKHGSNQPNAQPAAGEPDKFGRKPGEPHYGHNHK